LAVRIGGDRAILRQGRARVGVSGQAGNINGTFDPRGNIFEGPRQTRLSDAAAARHRIHRADGGDRKESSAGTLFPGPAAINSQAYEDRPSCAYHGFCNRGGCHVNAKNSTAVSTIPKAMATGRLKVVTQAIVTSVAVDDTSGRMTGVVYVKGGQEYFQPAEVVLLAATPTRTSACCSCRSRSRSPTACRTTAGRSAGTTSATTPLRP